MKRRTPGRLVPVAIALVALLGLLPGVVMAAPLAAEQAKIYLVAIGDGGTSGTEIGCGDSLVPVTVDIPGGGSTADRITQALTKLFALHDQFYGQSGLYNSLYASNLHVDQVEVQGGTAAVYLSGTTSFGGVCDDPRADGQVEATASQFPGVTKAIVVFNGGRLVSEIGGISFPVTGHRVEDPFYPYWEVQGGLPIFGYPLTDQFVEGGYRVQYYERQRFEAHPENKAPYNVLFGLVGRQTAERKGLLGTPPFAPAAQKNQQGCEYFPETQHNLCGGFRAYWHAHGLDFGESGFSSRESLALFGYPIGEEFQEQLEDGNTYTVQYFERVRMEYHPENRPPYDVLLGRLTADLIPAGHR